MALLLRMGGVPARVATGFSPGGYSKRKQAWIVRDTDAHSWVEAWFDGYGWVTLDPTPSDTPARSQIASIAAPATPEGTADNPAGDPSAGGSAAADRRAAGSREELFNQLRGGAATATEDGGAGGSGLPLWPLIGGSDDPVACSGRWWSGAAVARAPTTRSSERSSSSRSRCAARGGRPPPV